MAKNTNKRIPVKHVRDKAKSAYVKDPQCYICGTTHDLELHHTHSITILLDTWADRKGYDISTDEGILAVREEFIEEHKVEIYDKVYTLCNPHHVRLHGVYGKAPKPGSEPKQERWIELQREKYYPSDALTKDEPIQPTKAIPKASYGSFFSEFI